MPKILKTADIHLINGKEVDLLPESQRKFVREFIDRGFKSVMLLEPESAELRIPFFILIQQNDEVQEGGKLKYRVQKGDVLKVLMRKTCLDGHSKCWKVQNMKTGVIGYVVAQRMKKRHSISQSY
jgi:hypothetical protein